MCSDILCNKDWFKTTLTRTLFILINPECTNLAQRFLFPEVQLRKDPSPKNFIAYISYFWQYWLMRCSIDRWRSEDSFRGSIIIPKGGKFKSNMFRKRLSPTNSLLEAEQKLALTTFQRKINLLQKKPNTAATLHFLNIEEQQLCFNVVSFITSLMKC